MGDKPNAGVDWIELIDVFDKEVLQAVEAEREDCAKRVRRLGTGDMATFISRTAAVDAILKQDSAPAPEPPPPEQRISTSGIMAKLRECAYPEVPWPEVEKDIGLLVEAERERLLAVVATVFDEGSEQSRDVLLASIRNAINSSDTEPAPPPEEPMTIAKLMYKLGLPNNFIGDSLELERDLQDLVHQAAQSQARRDARIVEGRGWHHGTNSANEIRSAAGLE